MSKLNWTGVIRQGILKLKLSFDSNVSIPDRMKIMEKYAKGLSNSDVSIIESHHFSDGSQMRAVINNRTES
ncbi:MAG: hypothetical protein K6F33_09335 [Bacteroidales bacterium]|nr:hypothetical protein [Bacteroidales bacterium]